MASALPGSPGCQEDTKGFEDSSGSTSQENYFLFSLEAKILE